MTSWITRRRVSSSLERVSLLVQASGCPEPFLQEESSSMTGGMATVLLSVVKETEPWPMLTPGITRVTMLPPPLEPQVLLLPLPPTRSRDRTPLVELVPLLRDMAVDPSRMATCLASRLTPPLATTTVALTPTLTVTPTRTSTTLTKATSTLEPTVMLTSTLMDMARTLLVPWEERPVLLLLRRTETGTADWREAPLVLLFPDPREGRARTAGTPEKR
mmetsp:Transcript_807/g.1693  ORF Transcript_807/g.1693 Transcript_807/m.1693 type:complete len:218 (-) Transcript_807:255-908(-)